MKSIFWNKKRQWYSSVNVRFIKYTFFRENGWI